MLVVVVAMLVAGCSAAHSLEHQLDKRAAYSYVSEFKRLPVYNFGLGKRGADVKRSPDLFKRDYDSSQEEYDEPAPSYKEEYGKRVKPYGFGLGKRLPAYSFGLGKRLPAYSFGLGKRPDPSKMYSFGLGKRDDYDPKRAAGHKFAFGLGKRQADQENL